MNQLVIILYSEQGKGKSSWIRRLLPPEWKEYFYNGIIDPSNKDDARLLATRIIINMEEFEGVKPGELAALKRIIAQDNVTQRKAYDIEAFTLPRHCSFIASTNNRQCLQDIGGNRRFLPITITGIDYHTPVNHPGIYAQALALLKGGFRYWYEGEEIETAEQAQRTAPHERPRGGEPLRLLPQTAARGPAGKVAPCQRHTDQAQHIRKGAGEPAHPAGTGAGTGKVRIRHTDQRAGDDRI